MILLEVEPRYVKGPLLLLNGNIILQSMLEKMVLRPKFVAIPSSLFHNTETVAKGKATIYF